MENRERIVSSAHLAGEGQAELSEIEYGLIVAHQAFTRWVTHCMNASGNKDLSYMDILVLHNVHHRERGKRLADICYVLNIEDSHTVSYSLKKLVKAKLVSGQKSGKEIYYRTTPDGEALCRRYAKTRARCLVDGDAIPPASARQFGEAARILRALSGMYDQAGRAAASL
jgi:predicted MarR family transcription regulator